MNSVSEIRNVVVIGIPNEITGADIGVAITLNIKNKLLTKEMLSEFLKDKLSLNKHPVKIIIYDEDFPKSKAGKSDRNKIFQDLINVVFYMIKNINSIPRADLTIRKEELKDTTLWDIQAED